MEVQEIWNSFNQELRNYVTRKVRDEDLANDIVQEVFEKVIKNIRRINDVENIQEYLYKITRNTIADSFRSRKLVFEEFEQTKAENSAFSNNESVEVSHEASLNTIVSEECVQPFIDRLPTKYKEALIASEINNMPQKELAEQLNISYSGAKSRVQRGKEKLKNLLQDCCNFEHDAYGNLIQANSKNCGC